MLLKGIHKLFQNSVTNNLRFVNDLNKNDDYINERENGNKTMIIVGSLLAFMAIPGFIWLDIVMKLEQSSLLLRIRLITTGLMFVNFVCGMLVRKRIHLKIFLFTGFFITSVYSTLLAYYAGPKADYWVSLNFIILFWITFIKFSYRELMISGFVFIFQYSVIIVYLGTENYPLQTIIRDNLLLWLTYILTSVVAYTNNLYSARNFSARVQIESMYDKLKSLDKAKTQFFANISHEIRTPLSMIHSPVENIVQNGKIPSDLRFYKRIYNNSSKLLELINTLLDFSRIESGAFNPIKKTANISEAINKICFSVESAAEAKEIHFSYMITPDINAELDIKYYEKAVLNLLSNAFKFTPPKGSVELNLRLINGNIILSVKDSGIGIDKQYISKIFDRFSQADGSTSCKYEGTGIGLSFAAQIAQMHGGDIRVISELNKGSEFIMQIPQGNISNENLPVNNFTEKERSCFILNNENNDSYEDSDSFDFESRLNDPVILVVEDNADMRDMICEFFRDDYRIVTAENGLDAIGVLEKIQDPPDIIISDVMMPKMDGYELAEKVHSQEEYEGIPFLFLTAKADKTDSLLGFEKGAVDYILKPFNPAELKARVKAQLQMKQLRDELKMSNIQLKEKLQEFLKDNPLHLKQEAKIKIVMDFILENYQMSVNRKVIAEAVNMSESHLSRLFKDVTGKSLVDYVNEVRVDKAESYLRDMDLPIYKIAALCGFENVRSMNRCYRKFKHISPRQFRENISKGKCQ